MSSRFVVSPRDVFWLEIAGLRADKVRVCVVTRVEEDYVELIYGQGNPGRGRNVAVTMGSIDYARFRLSKDTHFREENVVQVKRSACDARPKVGICTAEKFVEFIELAEAARRRAGS
ncbi:MAG: hypothetical protein AABZ30_15945 [Myxococcota bacterium]